MKRKFLNLVLLLLLLGCKKEYESIVEIRINKPTTVPNSQVIKLEPFPFAEINVYKSESDYWLNQNIIHSGKTNAEGFYQFNEKDNLSLFIQAFSDSLNNLRYRRIYLGGRIDENKDKIIRSYQEVLSTTPTKLQIKVLYNNSPVEGARVQVYYNENDFKENKKISLYERNPNYFEYSTDTSFVKTTEKDGFAMFYDLEPREYWIRITKDNFSNLETTYKTFVPLEDNFEKVNKMEIEIK